MRSASVHTITAALDALYILQEEGADTSVIPSIPSASDHGECLGSSKLSIDQTSRPISAEGKNLYSESVWAFPKPKKPI